MLRFQINIRWLLPITVLLASCSDPPSATPGRTWQVLAENLSGGVVMGATNDSDGSVLAVGGQADLGALWRISGSQVTPIEVPKGMLLTWASRAADGTVLVVGSGKRAMLRDASGNWTTEVLPAGDELWGCENLGNGKAFAVGGVIDIAQQAKPALLERTPGGWAQVPLPGLSKPDVRLFKIAAQSASDIVVVGDEGLALHFDGSKWREEPSSTGLNLTTVRALPGGRYVAVGGLGSGVIVERSASGKWTTLGQAETGLSGFDHFAANGVAGASIWACGFGGWLESDGLSPFQSAPLGTPLTQDSLHFVLRLPSGDALAGGGNLAAWPKTMHGVLLRWTAK